MIKLQLGSKSVTDRQILWHHMQGHVDFFFAKFATALLASLAEDNLNNLTQVHYLMLKSCFGQHKGWNFLTNSPRSEGWRLLKNGNNKLNASAPTSYLKLDTNEILYYYSSEVAYWNQTVKLWFEFLLTTWDFWR